MDGQAAGNHISQGRERLLAYDKDTGKTLNFACEHNADSYAITLAKVALMVYIELLRRQEKFQDSFHKDSQQKALPNALIALVRMITEGPNIMQ